MNSIKRDILDAGNNLCESEIRLKPPKVHEEVNKGENL